MRVVIKEWPDSTATIMTDIGQVVWTFNSAELARSTCREWFRSAAEGGGYYVLDADGLLPECNVV